MQASGIIFAALDCDLDAIEEWNRWYDLEHTPMNLCLAGVMLSRRYVATPELHAVRVAAPGAPLADQRGSFLTTYVLAGDPQDAFDAMSTELPKLYDENRMQFPAEKKIVREGDVFAGTRAIGGATLEARDVPFVGHTGVVVVQRRGDDGRAERIAALDGVTGTWSMESRSRPGLFLDMIFVEDQLATRAVAIRDAVPHTADVVFDAAFELINPLAYPWADAMRASDLPPTVA